MREIAPGHETFWFEMYGRIAKSGECVRFEHAAAALTPPRYYDVFAFRVGEPDSSRVGILFHDITARKRLEERQTFLLQLGDAVRPLANADAVHAAVTSLTRAFFAADRCYYCEIVGNDAVIRRDASAKDLPSVVGVYPLSQFPVFKAVIEAGRPFVVADTRTTNVLDEPLRALCLQLQIASFVNVPVIKEGKAVGLLAITQRTTRQWTAFDAELAQEAAERASAAVERTQIETALRDSEERSRQAIDAANAGTWSVNLATGSFTASERALELHGLSPGTVMTHEAALACVHPEDRAAVEAGLQATVTSGRPFHHEHRVPHRDGSIRWVSSHAERRLVGEEILLVGLVQDITERRHAEEVLREADRNKDEFLAMLAHELRNPLAPIRTGLELIRLAGDTPGSVERVRAMMDRQISHMVRLIDDLLDVSRITSGKIKLHREPAPLDSLVKSAIEANRAAMAAKHIELSVGLPKTLCVLDVDPTRFIQVLSNLLHNATKFTDPGGSIAILADVTNDAVGDVDQLRVSVTDSGIGISPDFLPRVFDLFTQGDRTSSQPGLGLGLALARRLVEMHGGRIDVHSEGPGRGTAFVIQLPLSKEVPQSHPAVTISSSRVDCRVVVIDDNRDAATVTAMLVEELGGECRTAYDGETGLREVVDYRPDLVLLDIGMPRVDGYETCRRIRLELGDDVVVVAVTGFGQEQDKDRAARAGFDAHLTKPADPAALQKLLTRCRSGVNRRDRINAQDA